MHVLGGFGVASLGMSIAAYRHMKISFFGILSFYVCIALGWELYELLKDVVVGVIWNGWSDTISDLINGVVGVVVAYYLLKK